MNGQGIGHGNTALDLQKAGAEIVLNHSAGAQGGPVLNIENALVNCRSTRVGVCVGEYDRTRTIFVQTEGACSGVIIVSDQACIIPTVVSVANRESHST